MIILGPKKPFLRARLFEAPLREEREQYEAYLRAQGVSEKRSRVIGSRLLHINRLLDLVVFREVHQAEVELATRAWVAEIERHAKRNVGPSTGYTFKNTAENWLRFNNLLVAPAVPDHPFGAILNEFTNYIQFTRHLSVETVRNHRVKISLFLRWVEGRRRQISDIKLTDVDQYLQSKRDQGLRPHSMVSNCQSLRTFFRYASSLGLSTSSVARGIRSPVLQRHESTPQGPRWKDVRRLLEFTDDGTPGGSRITAILFLCAIYGLRGAEIRSLTLDSFDWINETFWVQRAKKGMRQEFPIQHEVGEAILQYIRGGRPLCSTRVLFVTFTRPHQAMVQSTLANAIRRRMKSLNIRSKHYGTHAFRHACATELLRQGSSLIQIADFLGHRSLQSVGIYAKLDLKFLQKVSAFSLDGLV